MIYQTAISQPSNDSYTNSIVLTKLNNWCSRYGQYTNADATPDQFSGPSCWTSDPSHDVWFKFTAIASSVNIGIYGRSSDGGTLLYPRLVLCTIDSNAVLTYIGTACNEASSSSFPGFTSIYTSELVIGNTYYIRVDGASDNTGSFQLCLQNFTSSVHPGQDCNTSAYLCNKNTITQVALVGWSRDSAQVANSCMDYMFTNSTFQPNNAVWYTFTIAKAGTLTFSIAPNNNLDDIDFGLYNLTAGDCSTLKVVRCSASRCYNDSGVVGATGLNMASIDTVEGAGCGAQNQDNWVKYLNVKLGESYSLLINNCSDTLPGTDNGFTLSFGGSCAFQGPIADFKDSIVTSCIGHNSIIFTDNSVGAASYSWNFGESANPAKANTPGPFTVSYSTAGTKTIVLSIAGNGGCEVVKASNIYINYPTPIILKDTAICKGQTDSIYANGLSSYKWSNGSVSNPLIVTPNVSTTYTLTATNNSGCSSKGSVVVTVNPLPDINISIIPESKSICFGNSATLTANGASTYKWSPSSSLDTLAGDMVIAKPTINSTYTVTGADPNGCINSGSASVLINITDLSFTTNPLSPIFGIDPLPVGFNYAGNQNVKWLLGDKSSKDTLTGKNVNHTYRYDLNNSINDKTTYTARMIVNYPDCPDTIMISIVVEASLGEIDKIFNIITTTTDEKFGVQGKGLQSFNLTVFNRFGDNVFENGNLIADKVTTDGKYSLWDGTKSNGSKLSSGTYFYILKATTVNNKILATRTGTLTILR